MEENNNNQINQAQNNEVPSNQVPNNEVQNNKGKSGLIVALLVIIALLVVIMFFMVNKKGNTTIYNNNNGNNPGKNNETTQPEETTNEETTNENKTTETTSTKLNESGVKKLQSSLITNVGGGYGLYFGQPKDKSTISIDDVNNPYLIAFNLKKYLATKQGMTTTLNGKTKFKWPQESTQTWSWDKCIGSDCENKDDYTKLYRVSKSEFNDFMHKTYNTTNNYDLLSNDEGKTKDIISSLVVVDSSKDYYNILSIPAGGSLNTVKTELVKYEEDDNFLYIYDKFIDCSSGEGLSACYYDVVPSPIGDNPIFERNIDSETEDVIDKEFKNNKDSLFTFKHTFKKSNGNYYWVSSTNFASANQ